MIVRMQQLKMLRWAFPAPGAKLIMKLVKIKCPVYRNLHCKLNENNYLENNQIFIISCLASVNGW